MLDVQNIAIAAHDQSQRPVGDGSDQTPAPRPMHLSSDVARVSLQDMIATSIALKSNVHVDIQPPQSQWPLELFTSSKEPAATDDDTPSHSPPHAAQVISSFERETLLLRNDLNFELWLSRENVKHIGRLYQDNILSKNVEAERQGLVSIGRS
jgi:hypothetical protein